MFTKSITKLAALALSLLALAGFASAQIDSIEQMMQDNARKMANTDVQINDAINRAMQDPQIQAAYNQCQQTSSMCGDFRWYAYNYVTTNGFTDGGAWMNTTRQMDARTQQGWWGVQDAERRSADAMNDWNGSFQRNQEEFGKTITGESTYINSYTGTQEDLPYGWQPETYNTYNGQTYYVDYTGQYYMVDPNNSGWMYSVTPWQPGQ
jgi:hypothetical protein